MILGEGLVEHIKSQLDTLINDTINRLKPDEWREDYIRKSLESGMSYSGTLYNITFGEPKSILCFRSEGNIEIKYYEPLEFMTGGLEEKYREVFNRVINAINNSNDSHIQDRSFTKNLEIALFKYGNTDSVLAISRLNTNTITLKFIFDCYNWYGEGNESVDQYGNTMDRYHQEEVLVDISLNDICNKDKIIKLVMNELDNIDIGPYEVDSDGNIWYYADIDGITLDISGYTVDVSNLTKKQISKLGSKGKEIQGYKSYKTDQEIVSNTDLSYIKFLSKRSTEFIRFLVLWSLSSNLDNYNTLIDAYKQGKILFNNGDAAYINLCIEYINKHIYSIKDNWAKEFSRKSNDKLVYPNFYLGYEGINRHDKVIDLINRVVDNTVLITDSSILNLVNWR